MTPRTSPRTRRGHTRWVLLSSVVALALLVLGVAELERRAPQQTGPPPAVPGVPALASEEVRTCTRQGESTDSDDIRAAYPVGTRISSTQLTACPIAYDGLEVLYTGEVIGELLPRRGGAWAQVNDDAYALQVGPLIGHREQSGYNTGVAVWLPDGLHEIIGDVGRPGQRGDVVLLEGVFQRADPQDGGGLTIRADRLEVLAPATRVEAPLHRLQALVAAVLAVLAAASVVWARRAARR